MVDIYVLECEDGNVYVGKTTRGKKRLQEHIKGKGSEWTKLHKPKKVMAYYTNATDSDERKVTEQMIRKHGAKKVRGAHLTKRKMSKNEVDKLNKDLGFNSTKKATTTKKKSMNKSTKKATSTKKKSTTYTCSRCGRQGHNKTQCYAKTQVSGKSISTPKKTTKSKPITKRKPTKTTSKKTTRSKAATKRKTTKSTSKPAFSSSLLRRGLGKSKNSRRRR